MRRLRAIACAAFYGVAPYWLYESAPHYLPLTYRQHLRMNLGVAWRWGTFRETTEDRRFEEAVNA